MTLSWSSFRSSSPTAMMFYAISFSAAAAVTPQDLQTVFDVLTLSSPLLLKIHLTHGDKQKQTGRSAAVQKERKRMWKKDASASRPGVIDLCPCREWSGIYQRPCMQARTIVSDTAMLQEPSSHVSAVMLGLGVPARPPRPATCRNFPVSAEAAPALPLISNSKQVAR